MVQRQPLLGAGAVAVAALALALLAAPAAIADGRPEVFLAAAAAAGATAVVVLSLRVDPAWPFSLALAFAVLSGNSGLVGFPIGPDRVLFAAGLASLALRRAELRGRGVDLRPLRVEGVHWVLFLAALCAIGSAFAAGTLTDNAAMFGLLDRFGLVPFAMFGVAPLVFATERQRAILLGTLVALGGYLGLTALFEGIGLDALVFPKYILDPQVGIHADRARGPFVEAEANGLALFSCAVAAAIGVARARTTEARWLCGAVAVLCSTGLIFTLSRGVWLAAVLATLAVALPVRELRRKVIPGVAVVAALIIAALAVVPGLSDTATERSDDEESVWVRSNTNSAALRMIEERPLQGFGWQRFQRASPAYFEQADGFPMRGVGEGSHNVFLSNASELGLPAAFIWLAGLVLAVGGALMRRAPPELRPWRIGLIAIAVSWLVIANVTPLAFAFPTLLLWTWAGVVWGGRYQEQRQ